MNTYEIVLLLFAGALTLLGIYNSLILTALEPRLEAIEKTEVDNTPIETTVNQLAQTLDELTQSFNKLEQATVESRTAIMTEIAQQASDTRLSFAKQPQQPKPTIITSPAHSKQPTRPKVNSQELGTLRQNFQKQQLERIDQYTDSLPVADVKFGPMSAADLQIVKDRFDQHVADGKLSLEEAEALKAQIEKTVLNKNQ